ncbi:hypothetical protein E2P81_ATG10390, partial [Venturia nashicola]
MFHEGDLQDGISEAIQQQKLVACFVRKDGDETSALWEREWFTGGHRTASGFEPTPSIPTVLHFKTILLRIDHGSKEAEFLSAFCPIDHVPTLVIIKNGTVVEKLEGDIGYEQWAKRLTKGCGVRPRWVSVD